MTQLLDKMFIKRFCLPSNSDINLYENGNKNISQCLCNNYNHVSCVLQGKLNYGKTRILSYGVNKMGDPDGIQMGIHAEYDAIRKLQPLKRQRRLININILVIRLSGKNKLQSSKPCFSCVETMKTLPQKLGYNVQRVYYSNSDGYIVKTSLAQLDADEKHFSRFTKQCKYLSN